MSNLKLSRFLIAVGFQKLHTTYHAPVGDRTILYASHGGFIGVCMCIYIYIYIYIHNACMHKFIDFALFLIVWLKWSI